MAEQKLVLNAIPADSKLERRVKRLGPKETVKYRLVGSYDPKTKTRRLRTVCIPSRDTVTDPDTGIPYDIAYVKNNKTGGEYEFGDIWFEDSSLCELILHGNRVQDQKIYDYLERCNYNTGNPFRDPSAPELVERIGDEDDSKVLRNMRKQRQDALNLVEDMADADVAAYIKTLNLPLPNTPEGRKDMVEEHIENGGATHFLRANATGAGAEFIELSDWVEKAKRKEAVAYNKKTGEWSFNGGEFIFKVSKLVGISFVGEFATFLASPEGVEWKEKIEEFLKNK